MDVNKAPLFNGAFFFTENLELDFFDDVYRFFLGFLSDYHKMRKTLKKPKLLRSRKMIW